MHFDSAFNLPGAGAGTVLTSPSGDKLFYAVQLCFKPEHKVSNNIAEYEGLLAGLRAANALGIKRSSSREIHSWLLTSRTRATVQRMSTWQLILRSIERWKNASKAWS
jgi:ribonuclease HI